MSNVCTEETAPSGKNNEKNMFGFIVRELGGVLFAVELAEKTLQFSSRFFPDNKAYQNSIKFLKGVVPLAITGHKVYTSIKEFGEQKKHLYARQKISIMMLNKMGEEGREDYELDSCDFNIGKEILSWFTSRPKTESFKIVDFFDSEFESVSSKSLEKGNCYILVEFERTKFIIEADIVIMNTQILVSNCQIYYVGRTEKIWELKTAIYADFIKAFDVKNNVIELTAKGLQTRKRVGFDYDIKQFDVDALKSEIQKAIIKKKKRGYVMIGPPGVGKSSILLKMESDLPDIPIVYVFSGGNVYSEDVSNTFSFLRSISPCLAIFEDLDGYELAHKQDRTFGEFLEHLDGLKHKECIIVIATLNDASNVHPSLINRRGRFDKVFFIDYPKTREEFENILHNKLTKEGTGCDIIDVLLNDMTIKKLVDNKFSQADICECIDYLVLNEITIDKDSFDMSIDGVINSMMALKQCQSETMEEKFV